MAKKTSPLSDTLLIERRAGLDQEDQVELTTELNRMRRRPFGISEDGQPIAESNGKIIVTGINYMQELVGKRAAQNAPSDASPDQIATLVRQAQSDALDQLVTMLNVAISEERHYVTREYLLNESNNYTYEFDLFVAEYCRIISGNPDFHFEVGTRSIPASIAALARPLGIQRVYSLLPGFTAKFVRADMRVIDTTTTSARVQWYADQQVERIPEEHRLPYIRYACKRFQGAYAVIPSRIFNGQMAQVKVISCQANGDPCCEWEFTWQPSKKDSSDIPLLLGTILVVSLLAYMLFGLSRQTWLALLVVSILSIVAWLWIELRRLRGELDQRTALLQEQRDLSEQEYDKSERARSELQLVNIALTNRVDELTMLQKVGEALGRTTDLNELLDKSLETVISSLHFDRALLMLIDEKRQVLTGTRTIGGDPQVSARAAQLEFPLDDLKYDLVKLAHADEPQHYRNVDQQGDEENKAIARGLGVTEWLGTPLIAKGRRVGVLGVDNGVSQRPLASENLSLLFTVGTQIAAAIDSARLYQTLERRVEERTTALEQRNAELAIINSVQEGLASKLDMQAIYDLVGEKIREIFDAHSLVVATFNLEERKSVVHYMYEKGQRYYPDPVPFSQLAEQLLRTGERIVINENLFERAQEYGSKLAAGEWPKSAVWMPFKTGDQLRGFIGLFNMYREHAFSDSDVRLLETLTNSMGIALENARLFDETQHLLKETEQRNAELAIINSVQQGLASKLDFQAIIELVGEKIRGVFNAQVVTIPIYDLKTELTHYPYAVEMGKRIPIETHPLTKVAKHLLTAQQPLLLKGAEDYEAFGIDRIPGTEDVKSFLAVPLILGDQVSGAITLQNLDSADAFSDSDVRLLQTLASSMSVALENARLFDETQRLLKETEQRAAELAIINSVQEGLASRLEIQAIYDLVGDKIRDVFDAQVVTISTFDTDNQRSVLWYGIEKGKRFHDHPSPLTEGHRHFIKARQPLRISENWEKRMRDFGYLVNVVSGTETPKSTVFVPLIANNEVKGSVSLQNVDRENAFNEADVRLLTTLANSMSVALENARLFDETQRLLKETEQRAAELTIINSVQEGLASKLDYQGIIELVGDKIREIFNVQAINIAKYDAATDLFSPLYAMERGTRLRFDPMRPGPLFRQIINTRESLRFNTIEEYNAINAITVPGTELTMSGIYAPLIQGKEFMGVIAIENLDHENAFTDSDLRLLTTLANSMSVALENARLFDETQRLLRQTEQRAAELATINTVSNALAGELDLSALFELVGEQIRNVFNADIAYVALLDEEMNTINFPYTYGEELTPIVYGDGLTSKIIETGKPLLINQDIDKRREELGASQVGIQARSYLGVPIFLSGKAIGAVSVQSTTQEGVFMESDARLLGTIAANVGVAFQNARLFDEIQSRNREITESLEQQTATSEILRVIASSPTDIQPVLDVIAQNARKLCDASQSAVYRKDGQLVHEMAVSDLSADMLAATQELSLESYPVPLERNSTLSARAIIDGTVVHVPDMENEPDLPAVTKRYVKAQTIKSALFVPMLREGEAIGCIGVGKREPLAFTDQQIALLQTFASQAVIAIENVRLFKELQKRNTEITEALEQQTATSEILQVIASSPTEIQPVLNVIARNAAQLSGSDDALIDIEDKGILRVAAHYGNIPMFPEGEGIPLNRDTVAGRALLEGHTLQAIHRQPGDKSEYPEGDQWAQRYGYRMTCSVPLVREGKAIGAITIRRREPDLLGGKQIALIETFASQAVIAIENVRLFNELQKRNTEITEALEQQTATSEILSIIAENPTDVQPVLDAVAERAAKLCNSYDAAIVRIEGDLYRIVTHWGPVPIPADNLNNGIPLNRDSVTGRAMVDRQTIHLHDLLAEPAGEYTLSKEFYQTSKQRTMLVTPLVRENEVIGSIMIRRREVNPFTEKQISLLKIFADQAAIAIENVRLFNEVTRRKEYFEALFQNNPVAVVTIDNDATVTSWNPAAEKLFGYTREEALGQNIDTLVAKTEEIYADAVHYSRIGLDASSDAFQVIVKRTRKDGSIVDVELSSVPIIVQGEMQGIYALYHDITELQRARQEAIAANEAKSAFLATMSHEIRTPMNAVIGMSGLLMDTELNKEQRDYAETIRSSGDALLAIINDILDFSKIEAGRMDVEHQPFDLRECVESALDLTATHAIEKGLDIAYLIDDDVPAGIKSDVTRLRQILINLLSNAIKFTEKGEVVLTVKNGKSKDELLFTVRDTGIGISEGHLNRLFQSFSQADSSTTRRFGGTGLGLAISKRLAEMMGGEMHAESEGDGKGSIFVFTIRAEPASVPERKVERDVRSIQSILQGKHVLIVDDNPTNRRILTLQTEKWGMIPRETQSPNRALEWIRGGGRFDLAILDLQMPEVDGVMLAREIRKLRNEASLPIILLTSLGRREVGAEDLKFAAYLTKPLKPSHLYDALARVFARNVISPREDAARYVVDADLGKRHPLRILLAEDNAVNQKLALRILEQMGYRADVASNGIEAVESIERQTYDVILMDVQMPDMDGLDATREIRNLINAIQPRIIAMTANAMEGDREMCLAAGMDDYISKPIRVNELVEALMKAERR